MPSVTLPKVGRSEPVKRWQRLRSPSLSTASMPRPAPQGSDLRVPSTRSVINWCMLENPLFSPFTAPVQIMAAQRLHAGEDLGQFGLVQIEYLRVARRDGGEADLEEAQIVFQMVVDGDDVGDARRQGHPRADGPRAIAFQQFPHLARDHVVGSLAADRLAVQVVQGAGPVHADGQPEAVGVEPFDQIVGQQGRVGGQRQDRPSCLPPPPGAPHSR